IVSHGCNGLERLPITADLDVEIAGIQVEVVSSGSGMFNHKPADVNFVTEIELKKCARSCGTPFVCRTSLSAAIHGLVRSLAWIAGSASRGMSVQGQILGFRRLF